MNLSMPELLIILAVILLLFGSTQVPKLARSLGRAQKEFKEGVSEGTKDAAEGTKDAAEGTKDAAEEKSDGETSSSSA